MVAPYYQALPISDPDTYSRATVRGQDNDPSTFRGKLRGCWISMKSTLQSHADALDTAWLIEYERLGGAVFFCFMVLRLGLLSLSLLWGFLLLTPFYYLSLVSPADFLPYALQSGLLITLIIILSALPFVALMHDARSKIFHVLYAAYLLLAWREVCVYLVPDDTLGLLVQRKWVREGCFMVAGAATMGCGAVGWTVWGEGSRGVWAGVVIALLLLLQVVYQAFK